MAINETAANYSNPVDALLQGHSQNTTQKEEDPLGRDAFLTMLVAQMKHQDPLNPLEGTDFTAQLAQYSSLEQQFNTNDLLTEINTGFKDDSEDNLLDYIGKEIVTETNTLLWKNNDVVGGGYTVENSGEVVVSIYDQEGSEVRRLYAGHKDPGTYEVDWDGKDTSGISLGDGSYVYKVLAMLPNGAMTPLQSSMSGKVTGVTYEHGTPYLLIGDKFIDPQTVIKVVKNDTDRSSTLTHSGQEYLGMK
jgi:flagellar basal-body rod modification protein FlgD